MASTSRALPVQRLNTLPERISRYPTPVGGLALGIASLGLAWERVGTTYTGEIAAGVAIVLLLLLTTRFVLYPQTVQNDLRNPVAGAVVPTYAMAWMLVSITLHQINDVLGSVVWAAAVALHVLFLVSFVAYQFRDFHLTAMVPAWFVPPVGIITAAVSYRGPDSGVLYWIAVVALYFGMISYAIMLPIMFYRFIFKENVPQSAMPTLAILAAPASLSMVGYLSLIENPQPLPVFLLQGIAVLMTAIVYVAFAVLLFLPFSPGFAAYTFPMAIGATAQFVLVDELEQWNSRQDLIDQVHMLGMVELWIATVVIGYVCVRYLQFAWQHWRDAHGAAADV